MAEFSTIEEALEELRNGRIILVTDDEDREMRGTSSARRNMPQRKTSILWRPTEGGSSACRWRSGISGDYSFRRW